jgi:hypothetical protein
MVARKADALEIFASKLAPTGLLGAFRTAFFIERLNKEKSLTADAVDYLCRIES